MTMDKEARRKALQDQVDAAKSKTDRNRLGQFSTPYPLARDIMEYVRTLFSSIPPSFLEPSVGTGVFYSALLDTFGGCPQIATGYEIDEDYALPARELWRDMNLDYVIADFLRATPQTSYDLIVANPPYSRHHHIPKEDKERLRREVRREFGLKISGLAGLYCYFMILSTRWLNKDGYSAWLIPSEFMDVNYGEAVKLFLLNGVELVRIHRFMPEDVKFTDALVTSSIVVFRNRTPSNHKVVFSEGGSLTAPIHERQLLLSDLNASDKWTHLFSDTSDIDDNAPKLGKYFSISRGVVTGDNKYFLLDEDIIRRYDIPKLFLRPAVSPPRNMKKDILSRQLMSDAGARYLFVCQESEDKLRSEYPSVWKYIEKGLENGVDKGYICRQRTPWYHCKPNRNPMFIIPYMSRNAEGAKPFRFILNDTVCVVPNSYLLLFPKESIAELCGNEDLRRQIWNTLNDIPKETLLTGGRVYGGGLYKLEPGELMNIPVPDLDRLLASPISQSLFGAEDFAS